MSIFSCYSLGCKEQTLFSCTCSKNVYICQSHTSEHLALKVNHEFKILVQSVKKNQKQKIYDHLNQMKQAINKNIKKINEFTEKLIDHIIHESNRALKLLIKERKHLEEIINLLSKYPLKNKEVLKKAESIDIKDFDVEFNLNKISEAITYEYLIERKMKDDEYAIIFGTSLSSNIDLIDLETFKRIPTNLPVNDMINYNGCCKIEDNKYFIYGGCSSIFHGTVRIIDIKDKSAVTLDPDVAWAYHGLCLYNKNIYCFGGESSISNPQVTSKKFNLETKKWISIQSMPEANYFTTPSVLKKRIFVSGFQSTNIYIYHPNQNIFYTSKFSFTASSYKYLFENWIVCFGSRLYEIDGDENLVAWQNFTDAGNYPNSSASFRRGKNIYFAITGPRLYRINTENKSIESVNILS